MKNKTTKLKKAGIIALIISSLAAIGITYNNSIKNPDKRPDKMFKYEEMTVEQMEKYLEQTDTVLARLQKVIDSKDTNPEERFEARRMYKSLNQQRQEMQKELDKAKKKEGKVTFFNYKNKAR
jgi:Na+/phosphate symporter